MQTFKGFYPLIRPLNVLIGGLSIWIGGAITGSISPVLNLLLASLSGMLITAAANTINDYFDIEIDKINKPERPLPSGYVNSGQAYWFAIILFFLGTLVSFWIIWPCIIIAFLSSVLLYLYSARLKRTALWGNLTVALLSGLALVYGGLAVGNPYKAFLVGGFAFLYHLAREIIKDTEDMKGDRKEGLNTFPIRYGVNAALRLASSAILLLIALTFLPVFFDLFKPVYYYIVGFGVDLFLIYTLFSMWTNSDSNNLRRIAFSMKLNMLAGLLAVYLGS